MDEERDKLIDDFRRKVVAGLKQSAGQFSKGKIQAKVQRGQRSGKTREELKMARSITSKVWKMNGEIQSISFPFERHGVFLIRGVSSSHPVTSPRDANDWISPVLDKHVPGLADKIAEINANKVIKLKM